MAITRRRWMLGAAAGVAGCGRNRRHGQAADSITVLYQYDETVLGPNMDEPAQFLMFLPLVAWNTRGELEGRLAESWKHSPDYRTWTIRLRDGIRWHDGVPVTAHDIKFNLDLRSTPDVAWFTPDSFDVKVIDDLKYTITYRKNESTAGVLDDWTVYYPRHCIEKLDPREFYHWDFWTHPVGNGPYRHVRTVPKTMLHLHANPDYYRGKPGIANVVLKFDDLNGTGTSPASIELLSGNADAATGVSRTDVFKLAGDPRFRVYEHLGKTVVTCLFWNHKHLLFVDPQVRRALTMAINRRELFQLLNFSTHTPILDAPFSDRQLQRGQFPEPIPYDPELAGRLLDQAGWVKRNRQGVRERDGKPFRFPVIAGSQGGSGQYESAVYIQSQLKRIGVQMEIDWFEGQTVFQRAVTGDFQAAICIAFGRGMDARFMRACGYDNPRSRQLTSRLETAFDPDQEDRVYEDMSALFREDVPATFLYPEVRTTITSRRIRGFDRSPYRGDPTWCMDQLWLEGQG
jgi:peptide/nickel transport system substrate-binding protein